MKNKERKYSQYDDEFDNQGNYQTSKRRREKKDIEDIYFSEFEDKKQRGKNRWKNKQRDRDKNNHRYDDWD